MPSLTATHGAGALPLAVAVSCAIACVTLAAFPYRGSVTHLVDVSDFSVVPDRPEPSTVYVALPPPDRAPVYLDVFPWAEPVSPPYRAAEPRPALLAKAQAHLGRNPTGWAHLWCARFIAMLAPDLAKRVRNPNLARAWAALPKSPKKPGAIVVLTRKGGGHIGVVKGFTKRGDPIVISGNARGPSGRRVVAETVYPSSRVIAYVSGG